MTLTSDLSRKNLEKDFERMDTPQGTFYRKQREHPIPYTTTLSFYPCPIFDSAPFINISTPVNSNPLTLRFLTGVYFDILLALDGSEFNAELVCQGEIMGRCTARFR